MEDPVGRRSGGVLTWTAPPDGHRTLNCTRVVRSGGPLVVIANWFPGNFHHFLHDTVPILFFVRRFRSPARAFPGKFIGDR